MGNISITLKPGQQPASTNLTVAGHLLAAKAALTTMRRFQDDAECDAALDIHNAHVEIASLAKIEGGIDAIAVVDHLIDDLLEDYPGGEPELGGDKMMTLRLLRSLRAYIAEAQKAPHDVRL